ncbi:MAG: hypothetical protein EOM24_20775 [Chloroflexia bacterium]|nr:hypothetical protein [Chloroflexia bacterium]
MAQQTTLTRRDFLALTGATLSVGALPLGISHLLHEVTARTDALPMHPNLLFLVTDQERAPQHWPDEWDYATNRLAQRLDALVRERLAPLGQAYLPLATKP